METILGYLKQPSTWRGIITVLGALGVYISPELTDAIIGLALGAFGVVEVVRNEKNNGA